MTTKSHVKKLVQPLLADHPDLALVGRLLVVKPVRHILRGIFIDRSLDADLFTPQWMIMFLFKRWRNIGLTWSERIYHPVHGFWDINNPEIQSDMKSILEQKTLPFLRSISSIDDFTAAASRQRFPMSSWEAFKLCKIIIEIARSDIASASQTCADLKQGKGMPKWLFESEEYSNIVNRLGPLLEMDQRDEMARVLHEWEAETVRNLKLEHLWEPSPFPLERAGIVSPPPSI